MSEEMIKAVVESISHERFVNGDSVRKFEEEFARFVGSKYAIAVNNGTNALVISLLSMGIGNGDLVLTSSASFIATANAILQVGANPIFVDIDERDYNISPPLVQEFVEHYGERIKAIVPVHLYGRPSNMNPISKIARENDIKILEDACQAHGALYNGKMAGSLGNSAAFSFYPSKNMTVAGDGGMITTNDEHVNSLARTYRDCGRKEGKKYEHDVVGFTARLNTINAAFGREQLKFMESEVKVRRNNAKLFQELLSGIDNIALPPADDSMYSSAWHQYVIRTKRRDSLAEHLAKLGIETGIHYPIPIHQQPVYRKMKLDQFKSLPVTEAWAKEVLSIPVHPRLSTENIENIAAGVRGFFRSE